MSSSATGNQIPTARHVALSDEALTVELADGRTLVVPLGSVSPAVAWYP